MKLTRYIRPTARRTTAQQMRATDRDGIAITIIEGDQRRTWADALKQLKPGGGLLIEDIGTLGRRYETRRERIEAVAAKGASIVLADGSIHGPDCLPSVVAGMSAPKSDEPRKAHNRTPEETLAEAKRLWTQKQYQRMTNGEVAEACGLSIPTLTREFGPRSRYIETRPGRPKRR